MTLFRGVIWLVICESEDVQLLKESERSISFLSKWTTAIPIFCRGTAGRKDLHKATLKSAKTFCERNLRS
jgi:hypothetical protein